MPNESKFRVAGLLAFAALVLLPSCAVTLPPAPLTSAANPQAPEAASAPLRPSLLTSSRTFLSPAADDREEKSQQKMDMGKMKHGANDMGAMSHSMSGMSDMAKPATASADSYYTCVMHPQIHEDKPGQCPICGMALVKKPAAPEGTKP